MSDICRTCGESNWKQRKQGRMCRTCAARYQHEWYVRNTDRARRNTRRHALKQFGLTLEDVERMKRAQKQRCAICNTVAPLHVDHHHRSGRVRALLCGPCNRGLGLFDESPRRLRRAADYITKHTRNKENQ